MEVTYSVKGIKGTVDLHWLTPIGVVDNDGRSADEIAKLRENGVYALSVYSVESIYYHPKVQELATQRRCSATGEDAAPLLAAAETTAISIVEKQKQRLAERRAERALREKALAALPGEDEIAAGGAIPFRFDVPGEVKAALAKLEAAIAEKDLKSLIGNYPVRETGALEAIAKSLGFKDRKQYESTVRNLLSVDAKALAFVRSMLGPMAQDLGI